MGLAVSGGAGQAISLTSAASLHLDPVDAKIAGGLASQITLGAVRFQWNKSTKHIARLCLDCWKA